MISDKMQSTLNSQINVEFHAAYLYLSMAAYLESANLNGMAAWMMAQSKEEVEHGMKVYQYIIERGSRVELAPIGAVATNWESPRAAFEEALAHEKKVTAIIHAELTQANEEKDYATAIMLQYFVTEQVEEEATFGQIVETFKMMGNSTQGLFMLDKELGKRQ